MIGPINMREREREREGWKHYLVVVHHFSQFSWVDFIPMMYLMSILSFSYLYPPSWFRPHLFTLGLDRVSPQPVSPPSNPFHPLLPDFQMTMLLPWWEIASGSPLPSAVLPRCSPQSSSPTLPENLLQMQILKPHPDLLNPTLWDWGQ